MVCRLRVHVMLFCLLFPLSGCYRAAPDLELMWETQPLPGGGDPTHGPSPRASTDRAIMAAARVFATTNLVGKTPAEVKELLGDPKTASNSAYNFPFYPPPDNAIVYRFDTGAYGNQYHVLIGEDGTVVNVVNLPIE